MIRLAGVRFTFSGNPGVTALAGIDVLLQPGVTLVTGSSGGGKSTLLRLLATLLLPDEGRVAYPWGRISPECDAHTLRNIRSRTGYLPQDKRLAVCLSCAAALEYLARVRGCAGTPVLPLLQRWALEGAASQPLRALSAGEARRWLLAQSQLTHLGQPQLWLLDEPLSGLDRDGTVQLRRQLAAYRRQTTPEARWAVVASHNLELADLADALIHLEDGRLSPA